MLAVIILACIIALFIIVYWIIPAPKCDNEHFHSIRLSMKALIRWEQLNKKAFSQLNYNSDNDILSLFYVCTQQDTAISLDEFKKALKEDDLKRMIKDFERLTSFTSQFQNPPQKKQKTKANKPEEIVETESTYIKDIVPMLIINGLDAEFALNKMELCDLPLYTHAYDQKIKDTLTTQRWWTFLQLLPHLPKDASPERLFPFKWELEEKEANTLKQTEEGTTLFKAFMNSKKPK